MLSYTYFLLISYEYAIFMKERYTLICSSTDIYDHLCGYINLFIIATDRYKTEQLNEIKSVFFPVSAARRIIVVSASPTLVPPCPSPFTRN